MPRCAILRRAVPYCTALCRAVPCHAVLCRAVPRCARWFGAGELLHCEGSLPQGCASLSTGCQGRAGAVLEYVRWGCMVFVPRCGNSSRLFC